MRQITVAKHKAELLDDGSWLSSSSTLTKCLDRISKPLYRRLSPADGDPLATILFQVSALMGVRAKFRLAVGDHPELSES